MNKQRNSQDPEPKHVPIPEAAMPTHDQISALAHQLWLESGQPEGVAEQNWCEAEQRLLQLVREKSIPSGLSAASGLRT